MKISVGTTSKQKLGYLQELLNEIGILAEILPVDVESGISEQPVTEEETKTGSINRALAAFEENPNTDFGLGIEVGYHMTQNGKYEMFCSTSIVDKSGLITSCFSSKFLLPEFHQKILSNNKYLGQHVREYKKEIDEPLTNYVRELVRGRKPLVIEATRNAILNYLS